MPEQGVIPALLERARRKWKVALAVAASIVLFVGGTMAIRIYLWASIPYRGYGGAYAIVEIPEGAGAATALTLLEQHGVVKHFTLALTYLELTGRSRGMKTGEYSFGRPMTPREVFDKIIAGDVYYHRVTILEGLRSDEIFDHLVRSGFGRREDYVEAFHDRSLISDLDDEAIDLEGYLFPDTYSLQKGTKPRRIVKMMVSRFREIFGTSRLEAARKMGFTVREAVTMASLVERETAQAEENSLVSSVFHNRLKKRMRLQCDPTVIYVLAMRNAYDGNIRKRDLSIDSRYNTYRYYGLPPGPIGNPGAAALRAAIEPAETDYLYFVSMNTGRHHFSKTLREHNRAVWEYQKKPYRLRRMARSRKAARKN
jgi:UPF0755 protein